MSIENEMSVIGAICLDESSFDIASDFVSSDDFTGRHRIIYRALEALSEERIIPDLVSLSTQLKKTGELESIGGASYLATLVDYVPTAANIKYYAGKVREESINRQVKAFANSLLEFKGPTDNLIKLVEENAFNFDRRENTDPLHISAGLKKASKNMEYAYENRGKIQGLTTGINGLDFMLNGLQPGKVYLIAGRPAMGKSAFGLDIVRRNPNTASLFMSMEMEHHELAQRAICSAAKVDGSRALLGTLEQSDWPRLTMAIGELNSSKIWIQDKPSQRMEQVYSTARKWKRKHDIRLLVVDYLQLVDGSGNEYETIGNASKMFKRIAKELQLPVVVLSQLNRELEKRDDKRPKLSDLRGTGQIEQDADVIIFPYREAVYCECKGMNDTCGKGHKQDAEIIVAKHRGGKIGMVKAKYIGEHTTFIDV